MRSMSSRSQIAAVRGFNRFYTAQIGVLGEGLLRSLFSLTEARVLYELAQRDHPTATELGRDLGLDQGYLSRILRGFGRRGLVSRSPSPDDGRESLLALTGRGRRSFGTLDARSSAQVGAMLQRVPALRRGALVAAMREIEALLGAKSQAAAGPFLIRSEEPGDLGWIVQRHGAIYAQEYGYDQQFEALVADIVARFGQRHEPRRERCWIAERAGERVGSVLLVRKSKTVARLRLLLVEPSARGLRIGAALVNECMRFARRAGYRRITLWTQSELHAARRLYQQSGFKLTASTPHRSFGRNLVAQTWELRLNERVEEET
ncbi:MAG TPA: helix-turn-helix domain-containing GNAT family N-acetyltransferase [Myxococcales bacterium]